MEYAGPSLSAQPRPGRDMLAPRVIRVASTPTLRGIWDEAAKAQPEACRERCLTLRRVYFNFRTARMKIDEQKIDETVLALLYLTLHEGRRAWKSFDWNSLNRLHEKELIADPVNKAKSVVLTEKGLTEAERLFKAMFVKK